MRISSEGFDPVFSAGTRQQAIDLDATEFTSVVFRILHYRSFQCFRVVQNPENHRNESGGGLVDCRLVRHEPKFLNLRSGSTSEPGTEYSNVAG